jgi:DNA-binding transcriptional LysR family regulator
MLDVRRLRLLTELSRRGTIAAVARTVGYTPSAVSQSLAQLEREAGVALLERDGRRVRLTPAAAQLVERADRVLAELDAAEQELAAQHEGVHGSVVIGAFPSAAASIVVPAVKDLAARFPELVATVREHEPEDGIPLLRAGELDLLISESYDDIPPAPAGGLEAHPLMIEPMLLVLPPDSDARSPRDLPDASWIGGLPGTQFATMVERVGRAAGFTPRIVHRADDQTLHLALVEAGLGVGLLPALACPPERNLRYVPLEQPRRHVTALARRGAARRPAVAAALEAMRGVS